MSINNLEPGQPRSRNDDDTDSLAYADDGTDLTLIRWMLSLSPEERLQALQSQVQFINQVRAENGLN